MPSTTSKNLGQVAAVIKGPNPPTNTNVMWIDTSGIAAIKKTYDPIAAVWIPLTQAGTVAGDNWGTQVVATDPTLEGIGLVGNELKIARQGATTGQILRYNGTTWLPSNEVTGGITSVTHDPTLAGNGTVGQPLSIAQQGATQGQVLAWDTLSSSYKPVPPPSVNIDPGVIAMWAGSIATIPAGWRLCDGTGTWGNNNPVPNLKGQFVVGFDPNDGDYSAIGNKGGSKTVSLTAAQNGQHSHGVNDPGHFHNTGFGADTGGSSFGKNWAKLDSNNVLRPTSSSVTGISINSSGTGAPHENRPNYYTLAYIIKL